VDEPLLYLRDGASVLTLPLSEVLWMYNEANSLARATLAGTKGAAEATQAIVNAGSTPGPHRARASLGVYLLHVAMSTIEAQKKADAIVVPVAVAGQGAEGTPAPATPAPVGAPAPTMGPCGHPSDVACPACAADHQARRNAAKRSGGRAT
jgi:hypothetical protein